MSRPILHAVPRLPVRHPPGLSRTFACLACALASDLAIALVGATAWVAAAAAADLPARDLDAEAGRGPAWGAERRGAQERACTLADITPAYGPIVPTNSFCDPTYVGSAAGLSRPSSDGTLQPPAFRAQLPWPQTLH